MSDIYLMSTIIKYSDMSMTENLKYHIENNISIFDNVFRPGSDAFMSLIEEARNHKDYLLEMDKSLYENSDVGLYGEYEGKLVPLDLPFEVIEVFNEAEYRGKKVKLNHPQRSSGPKKYKVYVKNPDTGNVIQVNFGDETGGLRAKISDPAARKSFAARHKCAEKKDKTKPGYWACRLTKFGHLFNGKTYPGFW